jgi:hypothetical protein
MEKRLEATLDAVKTVQPALAKFYNSLSDEQQARFNSMRLASRPLGWQRRAISGTLRPAPNAPDDSMVSSKRMAAMFWPDAADDLVQYVLFPKGNDRFWQHGYDSIVGAAFAGSAIDDRRRPRSRPAPNQVIDAATPAKVPLSSANLCGGTSAADDANALIERIEHAIGPNASQRDVLEQLRTALAQVVERIRATCPAAVPATLAERLSAIQDRIWAMRDVLLTLRLPFETFYNSLTDEQQRRLRGDAANSGKIGADVTNGRAQSVADGRGCGSVAVAISRHGTAYRQFMSYRSAAGSHGQVRGRIGSPRRHAVCGDEHGPRAATVIRYARQQAKDGSQPGAAPSQTFWPCRRAFMARSIGRAARRAGDLRTERDQFCRMFAQARGIASLQR